MELWRLPRSCHGLVATGLPHRQTQRETMTKVNLHRTYPCGYQESIRIEGWTFGLSIQDTESPKPCPLHALNCRRA